MALYVKTYFKWDQFILDNYRIYNVITNKS